MRKVGFFLSPTMEGIGGISYFRNLFTALKEVNDASVKIIVFVPKNIDSNILDMLLPGAREVEVVRTSMLQRFSLYWLIWKFIRKVFGSDLVAFPLCIYHGIDIVSHSGFTKIPRIKIINWIPDFQYIHLPNMFNQQEVRARNLYYSRYIAGSDRIVVSSNNAAEDLLRLFSTASKKIFVLNFVCQVPNFYWELGESNRQAVQTCYKIEGHFFYVPNQFWKHKNHAILVDAVRFLKNRGIHIQMVCSGVTEDPRDLDYFQKLEEYIVEKECADSFKILGVIPYEDVFTLINYSLAVINPSRFEGWSTTVEECKSAGKNMLLSDIGVHHEQMPESLFFEVDDANLLADYLEKIWIGDHISQGPKTAEIIENNKKRTEEFGKNYLALLDSVLSR